MERRTYSVTGGKAMNKHTRVAALLAVNGVINLSITEHGLIVTNVFSDTFILDDEVLLQG
jgi:hypothetical protein